MLMKGYIMNITINKSRLIRVALIIIAIVLSVNLTSFGATLKSPGSIKLTTPSTTTIRIKCETAQAHSGYDIQYSKQSSFSNYTRTVIKNKGNINHVFAKLDSGTKYYFKVRMFKTVKGTRQYGAWSKVKSKSTKAIDVSNATLCYVKAWKLNLGMVPEEDNEWKYERPDLTLPYMAKLYVFGSIGPYSSDQWVKVVYKGQFRYAHIDTSDCRDPFTTTQSVLSYDKYEQYCQTDFQRQILKRVMDEYKAKNITAYDSDHKTYFNKYGKSVHKLDCSSFVRYIFNPILGKDLLRARAEWQWGDGLDGVVFNIDEYTTMQGQYVSRWQLEPGDLVFFEMNPGNNRRDGIDHVGIYLGDNEFIACTGIVGGRTNGGLAITALEDKYANKFKGAIRYTITELPRPVETEEQTELAPAI